MRLRFAIRDLLWLTLVVGIAWVGDWITTETSPTGQLAIRTWDIPLSSRRGVRRLIQGSTPLLRTRCLALGRSGKLNAMAETKPKCRWQQRTMPTRVRWQSGSESFVCS